jgi:polysaccharide biosynthesis transport protein
MASPAASPYDFRDILRVMRERAWIIVLAVAVTTTIALVFSFAATPKYASTSSILIQRSSTVSQVGGGTRSLLTPELTTEVELQFARSEAVRQAARENLGYGAGVTASAGGRGVVMNLRAVSTDAERAAEIANAYAQAYIDTRRDAAVEESVATAQAYQARIDDATTQIDELDEEIALARLDPQRSEEDIAPLRAEHAELIAGRAGLRETLASLQLNTDVASGISPQIIATAAPASAPFTPDIRRNVLMGIIAGILLGVALAFLRDYFDDSVKSKADLELATGGVTTLALIPRFTEWKDRGVAQLASIESPASPVAEAYRSLRTSVQFASIERPLRTIQITSPRSQDGKSTTAANLGVLLARAGQRVILVDCDLRRPRLHDFFGLSPSMGFTSVLLGQLPIIEAVQPISDLEHLRVLPSGPTPPNPSELLASQRTAQLFEALREAADIVLIDSPPVLPVTDALVISDVVDGVIMVSKAGATGKKEAHRAVELLKQVDAPLIGTVLNGVGGSAAYGYGYGYGYQTGEPSSRSSFLRRSNGASERRPPSDRQDEAPAPSPRLPLRD